MRVGQTADVEDEVSIFGDAMLEAKRGEEQREPAIATTIETVADQDAELMIVGRAGVADQVGTRQNRAEQFGFALDRLRQGNVRQAQWVATPSFANALDQGVISRLQENDLAADVAGF